MKKSKTPPDTREERAPGSSWKSEGHEKQQKKVEEDRRKKKILRSSQQRK